MFLENLNELHIFPPFWFLLQSGRKSLHSTLLFGSRDIISLHHLCLLKEKAQMLIIEFQLIQYVTELGKERKNPSVLDFYEESVSLSSLY